jgi:hypothetical protein
MTGLLRPYDLEIVPDKRKVVGLIEHAHEGKICLPNSGVDPRLLDAVRWAQGAPPTGNANYAWIAHFARVLAEANLRDRIHERASRSADSVRANRRSAASCSSWFEPARHPEHLIFCGV